MWTTFYLTAYLSHFHALARIYGIAIMQRGRNKKVYEHRPIKFCPWSRRHNDICPGNEDTEAKEEMDTTSRILETESKIIKQQIYEIRFSNPKARRVLHARICNSPASEIYSNISNRLVPIRYRRKQFCEVADQTGK